MFLKGFKQPLLSREAFDAYFNRLPEKIQVKWFRDSGMIVGEIIADEKKFMTQGKNARDFIEMVNDAVYTFYEIPDDYRDTINKNRAFLPPQQVLNELNDKQKLSGSILVTTEKVLQHA